MFSALYLVLVKFQRQCHKKLHSPSTKVIWKLNHFSLRNAISSWYWFWESALHFTLQALHWVRLANREVSAITSIPLSFWPLLFSTEKWKEIIIYEFFLKEFYQNCKEIAWNFIESFNVFIILSFIIFILIVHFSSYKTSFSCITTRCIL